jgi:hypothetical protein
LLKWDLIDEMHKYSEMFSSLKFILHLDREIEFKGILRWSNGAAEFGDDYWAEYSDLYMALAELTFEPVDFFFPPTEGWRAFANDALKSNEHLIFAKSAISFNEFARNHITSDHVIDQMGISLIRTAAPDEGASASSSQDVMKL